MATRRRPTTIFTAPRVWAWSSLLALSSPAIARAGNEAHVRTPVLWEPAPACGLVLDRGATPVLHLDYAIPADDTALTPDELPDSRRHQFFALCRDRAVSELPPAWISRDDVDRAVDAGLIPADSVPAIDVLDERPDWADCALRITADDDRRPITAAQAALGVDWDLAAASPGVWRLAGYTFEPALNLWSPRTGFVKIVDDPDDPEQDLPALAIVETQAVLIAGASVELAACVDALTPATAVIEWSPFAPTLDWRDAGTLSVPADGDLPLPFVVPDRPGEEILVRVRLVDAMGREWIAHAPERFAIVPCEDDCTPAETGDPGGAGDDDSPGACACGAGEPVGGPIPWLLGAIGVWTLRRRPRPKKFTGIANLPGKIGATSVGPSTD